jgi:long-chain acyl-CoA synthetase
MHAYVWNPWRSARVDPQRVAVATDEGERVTYAELVDQADRVGACLRELGVPDGARIATDLRVGPEFFALALATLKFGYGLFPTDAARSDADFALPLPGTAGPDIWVTDGSGPQEHQVLAYPELIRCGARAAAADPAPREGHFIVTTSGASTGRRRVVERPRPRRPYAGVEVVEALAAGREFGPHIMANPTSHPSALDPALYALQSGCGVVVAHHWSPTGMHALIRQHAAASAYLSADLLASYAVSADRPAGLSALFHGGSACTPYVKRQAIARHGPILHEFYRIAQGTVAHIGMEDWLEHPGSVGRARAGLEVVVAPDGRIAPPHTVGELIVRARPGEFGERAQIPTGDVGYVDEEGYLYLVGRTAEGTQPVEAEIEHRLRAMNGVSDAVVFADPDATCLVEVVDGGSADWIPRISAAVSDAGSRLEHVHMFAAGTLERTQSGRLARVAAKQVAQTKQNRLTGVPERRHG